MSQQNLREFCVPDEEKLRSGPPQVSTLETSLAKLQLDYVDMYLMHWLCELMLERSIHCLAACSTIYLRVCSSAWWKSNFSWNLVSHAEVRTGSIRQNSYGHHKTNRLLLICLRNILPLFWIIQDQLLSQLSIKSRPIHVCHSIGCSSFVAIEGFF